ncbi:MAG: CHAT domain-containing tetratricopeptide repeat protein [Kibdelosporangium sp.]
MASNAELALSYLDQARESQDPDVIDTAVELCQRVVDAIPVYHPDRPVHLHNLSLALRMRFEHAGSLDDLEPAIAASRRALGEVSGNDPNVSAYRHNLAMGLWLRYGKTGKPDDLAEAIGVARRGSAGLEPGRSMCLSMLGIALYSRFRSSGSKPDLDEAITLIRTVAAQPGQTRMLAVLTSALFSRFEQGNDLADLDEAVAASLTIADAVPPGHPSWITALTNLSAFLRFRSKHSRGMADIDRAIGYGLQALEASATGGSDVAAVLGNIAMALRTRYERTSSLTDLEEAVAYARAAVESDSDNNAETVRLLQNLAAVLIIRYERLTEAGDLDEAITAARTAARLVRTDAPERPVVASILGSALRGRFEATGVLSDLDEAIAAHWQAVATTRQEDRQRAQRLADLAVALIRRFSRTNAKSDIEQAVTCAREASAAGPADRAYVSSVLGHVLIMRHQRTSAAADLNEAVIALRSAVRQAPEGHADRAQYLTTLGHALYQRFRRERAAADIAEAIRIQQEAIDAAPLESDSRAAALTNLALALAEDGRLGEAITLARAALREFPPGHRRHASSNSLLGRLLQANGELEEAFACYATAATAPHAEPSVVVKASWEAGAIIARSSPARAADLVETALRIRVESTSRRMRRDYLQHTLGTDGGGLAADAAALALAAGSPERALRLLELGRGMMFSQALDTRDELTDLRAGHPDLAARFVDIREQLDQPENPFGGAADRHTLARAFDAALAEIRALPGFADFLLPAEIDLSCAAEGPIAVVNTSRFGCAAILVTSYGIKALPLPELDDVLGQIDDFFHALETSNQNALHAVLEWLWDAAAEPILDAIGCDRTPGARWPRLWWVASGPVGFLPLHAAGYHRRRGRSVLDRVISSYTPTIRSLQYARGRMVPAAVSGALVVSMPTTPGMAEPLPHVSAEATEVCRRVPGSTLLSNVPGTGFSGLATKSNVLFHLDSCAISHFACHASSHADPSQSGLLLDDHQSDPLTVSSLAPSGAGLAQLAYLSACQTAFTPAIELVDEAIHLPSAFQLAGYAHVVGTLWPVNDAVASFVAADFYAGLGDTSDSARALHHAVRGVRDDIPDVPSLWGAYLHTGA